MSRVGRASSIALMGLDGVPVQVEVDVVSGLPKVYITGMPDAAVRQAQHRTWSALRHSGFTPPDTRVVINLTPANLPKAGSHFDLPIGIAILRAAGVVPVDSEPTSVIGELGLDGRLRPCRGVLPMVRAARDHGAVRAIVPTANEDEASLVAGIRVIGVPSLAHAAAALGADTDPEPVEAITVDGTPRAAADVPDMSDVIGNSAAIAALEVAAAGGHHLLMVGPPGAGKTMLAMRLPGLLPQLEADAALDVAAVRSLSGETGITELDRTPPFEAPHHSATAASLIGGGTGGAIRPGAAARASHGVLFLDEAPEFPRSVLDQLRQPLESGELHIHRAVGQATYPAQFQLVLAANPCPCGRLGFGDCSCTSRQRMEYFSRISGPLLDRIDLQVRIERLTSATRHIAERAASTEQIRERVVEARARAARRLRDTPWTLMGRASGTWLRKHEPLPAEATASIDEALQRGLITMRGYDRVLRLAFTMADLAGIDRPTRAEIGTALAFRRATT